MKKNPNIGCVVVPVILVMFYSLYLLSNFVSKEVQPLIGFFLVVVLGGSVIFSRFFQIDISKR